MDKYKNKNGKEFEYQPFFNTSEGLLINKHSPKQRKKAFLSSFEMGVKGALAYLIRIENVKLSSHQQKINDEDNIFKADKSDNLYADNVFRKRKVSIDKGCSQASIENDLMSPSPTNKNQKNRKLYQNCQFNLIFMVSQHELFYQGKFQNSSEIFDENQNIFYQDSDGNIDTYFLQDSDLRDEYIKGISSPKKQLEIKFKHNYDFGIRTVRLYENCIYDLDHFSDEEEEDKKSENANNDNTNYDSPDLQNNIYNEEPQSSRKLQQRQLQFFQTLDLDKNKRGSFSPQLKNRSPQNKGRQSLSIGSGELDSNNSNYAVPEEKPVNFSQFYNYSQKHQKILQGGNRNSQIQINNSHDNSKSNANNADKFSPIKDRSLLQIDTSTFRSARVPNQDDSFIRLQNNTLNVTTDNRTSYLNLQSSFSNQTKRNHSSLIHQESSKAKMIVPIPVNVQQSTIGNNQTEIASFGITQPENNFALEENSQQMQTQPVQQTHQTTNPDHLETSVTEKTIQGLQVRFYQNNYSF